MSSPNGLGRITVDRDGDVLIITIDRPARRNAFDGALARQMEAAIDGFDAGDARVGIITAIGPTFSSGQDLKAAAVGDLGVTKRRGAFGVMGSPPTKPLIAALEGDALGGGLELCLACDLIVASESVSMGLPEAARGLIAGGGGLFRLPKRIPFNVAMELVLTGESLPASEFHRLGLVNRLTKPGEALSEALTLAKKITACGPVSVAAAKQIVHQSWTWEDERAWDNQSEYVQQVMKSVDLREGLQAFAEKRAPQWKGR
ncbi:crotonase/enoyl-CoA hydratase family protein [Gordonia sp. CPCC 205515]|uniref:crotonase/enoyl-CoA hydratase family protein n=1 Tax=Gordonia sp. CPCC 205515 TaxID=3140791 RepID=UPI003AF3A2C3